MYYLRRRKERGFITFKVVSYTLLFSFTIRRHFRIVDIIRCALYIQYTLCPVHTVYVVPRTYIIRCALYIQYTLCPVHTLYVVPCTYSIRCALYIHYTLCPVHTLYVVPCTYIIRCALYIHYTLCPVHTLYVVPCTYVQCKLIKSHLSALRELRDKHDSRQ